MDWSDEGIILTVRRHGESAALVSAFTPSHGRHAGLVRGAFGPRLRGLLQPGQLLRLAWRARLAEHLGYFTVESAEHALPLLLSRPGPLAALLSACALVESGFPERAPQPGFFEGLVALFQALDGQDWAARYACWERDLLAALGFGLDLGACAVTGRPGGLAYVSPRTGRAVSYAAAEPWRTRLLPLPAFLLSTGAAGKEDVLGALALTGHFLERHLVAPPGARLPPARLRLLEHLRARPAR